MALVIKYLSQPNAGDEITIPDDVGEVRFGRASEAEIGFPAELDIVSRDHFRLRKELGSYKFVISRDHPVYSGGRALMDGEELDKISEIQLSGPTGPKLRIERMSEAQSNIPKTRVLTGGQDIGDFADSTVKGRRRLARMLGVVTLLVAAVAGGYFLLRQDLSAIEAKIPSISEGLANANAAAAGKINAATIIASAKESIYFVQLQLPSGTVIGTGTASVILLPDGTKALATNAHVAELYQQLLTDPSKAGMKLMVVQPKGPDYPSAEVVAVKIHPAWGPSNQAIERVLRKVVARAAQDVKPMLGYDVALLFVADPSKLGEPLKYASLEKIKAMRTGDPLLQIGYASEGLRGTDAKRPEPTSQAGIITAMTTFYLFKSTDDENVLVQHSVPAAGGASGSPMFNAQGEVVALLNAVNVADVAKDGARMTSAALVNYAQRADMLLDLVNGEADAKMPMYLKQMADAEARLTKGPEQIEQDFVGILGLQGGSQKGVKQIASFEVAVDQKLPDAPNGLYVGRVLKLDPKFSYLVLAISQDQRPIAMIGLDGSQKQILGGPGTSYVSYLLFNNAEVKQPQILYAVLDVSSLGPNAVEAGKVKIVVYQCDPSGGS